MELLESLLETSAANRVADISARESGTPIKGDFEGSVTGTWVELNSYGLGIVAYNQKQYTTRRLGVTSIPAGRAVQLTFANGIYYSNW
jgi:hypothetical protein